MGFWIELVGIGCLVQSLLILLIALEWSIMALYYHWSLRFCSGLGTLSGCFSSYACSKISEVAVQTKI